MATGMKVKAGGRTLAITGPSAEMDALIRDAIRGAEWQNARDKDAESASRCDAYEKLQRAISDAEYQRLRDLQDRGI
jgi:hypothetical protein